MWNTFKFFFVWFWLGVAAFVAVVLIAPRAEPGSFGPGVAGLVLAFMMCIPAYFLARPKRGDEAH